MHATKQQNPTSKQTHVLKLMCDFDLSSLRAVSDKPIIKIHNLSIIVIKIIDLLS